VKTYEVQMTPVKQKNTLLTLKFHLK